MQKRETLGSRIGFILISAGCAIGLGNIWRFPYIVGQYGGAAFVLLYLLFLVILGMPIMAMEFAVGRGSGKSVVKAFHTLEPPGTKWHWFGYFGMAGNYLLMMFYTPVAGWMVCYFVKMLSGEFVSQSPAQVSQIFDAMQQDPVTMVFYTALIVALGFLICSLGLKKGVEKITKGMMVCLLAVILVLAVRSLTLPGAEAGISFYLKPDFSKLVENGLGNAIFAAMGQAFFTLSVGIGSMAIFGSFIGKEQRLMGETVHITILDTFVAFITGLVIFPACFAFGIQPDSGPNLIFVTLPNVFGAMPGGQIWGAIFFLFMIFAALTTVIAVFQNIVSISQDLWGWSAKKASFINMALLFILTLPTVLGYNLLSGIQPLGPGSTILDLEDFIVSNNLLPLGSLVFLLFCTTRHGWGWDNFLAEVNLGKGLKFPSKMRFYVSFVLPIIVLFIFVQGYVAKFWA